jgi:hypothetical protein
MKIKILYPYSQICCHESELKSGVQSYELQMLVIMLEPMRQEKTKSSIVWKVDFHNFFFFFEYPRHQGDFREDGFGTWQPNQNSFL